MPRRIQSKRNRRKNDLQLIKIINKASQMYGFIKINNIKHVLKTKKEERERKNSHFPRFARSGLDITSRASDSRLQSSLAYGRSEMHFCKAEGGKKDLRNREVAYF
ncbi:hypothetical protein CEXT_273491 [Caerostris extrusa]|uniref:Uncharacterized protein n=1 Tax=Caerostris extrusa TaxID=172846 RepID=A0AAV4WC87_CAEEX|nr:hypothetical protein CEXT_273491 [Caerostris extrusa]